MEFAWNCRRPDRWFVRGQVCGAQPRENQNMWGRSSAERCIGVAVAVAHVVGFHTRDQHGRTPKKQQQRERGN